MTFSIRSCEVAMADVVTTVLESLAALLLAAGAGVTVAALIGAALGVGVGLMVSAVVLLAVSWWAARS
jgi:hypothetical protein